MFQNAQPPLTGDAEYTSQVPFVQSMLSHTILTPICVRGVFFNFYVEHNNI